MRKRAGVLLLALVLAAGALLPGCSKEDMLNVYGSAVSAVGNVGLDLGLFLQGERRFGEDRYTGSYSAEYEDFTGTEHLFGGTMLEKRTQEHVQVTVTIRGEGSVRFVWNCGASEPVVLADGEGTSVETAYLAPGSNYFNLELERFTGSVEIDIA